MTEERNHAEQEGEGAMNISTQELANSLERIADYMRLIDDMRELPAAISSLDLVRDEILGLKKRPESPFD